ncbi:MAG: ornithine cyclodeaminase family protein [Deltaproteobacteria bacterium]|nr:ornithine cyclodeaminase family protein [Deltaproteobacteria bacterium]MDZ4342864.1 ornithine cyclodeaminase family protein [Candidatus Binatia bacterium]
MIYLNNRDISQLLTPKHCIEALEEAFHVLAQGRALSRPRTDVWVPCGRSDGYYRWGSMEGAIEPWGVFVTRMKSDIVTWTPEGTDELHCVQPGTFSGFLMVFSTRNGEPLAMMNDGILHHLRVAAGAALGVKYLARADASVVGMIGSGGMARAYLPAFREVRRISKVKVYSSTKAHRESYAEEMSRELGIPVEPFDRAEPVVRGSDIVATCTDSTGLVITNPSWIEKGMHLANLSSREWSWDAVQRCDLVVQVGTETLGDGCGKEDSERKYGWASWLIGQADDIARIPKRPVSNIDFLKYPSLVDLLKDPSKRRTSPDQITFFHNLGLLGFQFAAVAAKAYALAREKGVGQEVSTEPFLQDIRD